MVRQPQVCLDEVGLWLDSHRCVWIRYVCGETATGVFEIGRSVVRQPQVCLD